MDFWLYSLTHLKSACAGAGPAGFGGDGSSETHEAQYIWKDYDVIVNDIEDDFCKKQANAAR